MSNYSNSGRVFITDKNATSNGTPTNAAPSLYNTFNSPTATQLNQRVLTTSRLWKGVPQLTNDQLAMFEAAYTGHTHIFVTGLPKFMTTGIYADKSTAIHVHALNLKRIIECASTGFNGSANILADFSPQDDGNGRKVDHLTRVSKDQNDISIRLHEFAGLPVKNAIETWLTGTMDIRSEHGNYLGNLNIPGGWGTINHSMSILVVQTDPSWSEIQDAAYYFNVMPTEVPFAHFEWTKGEHTIIEDYDLTFKSNEDRSPAVMAAAELYMNTKILNLVDTNVFNSRKNDAGINSNVVSDYQ